MNPLNSTETDKPRENQLVHLVGLHLDTEYLYVLSLAHTCSISAHAHVQEIPYPYV